MEIKELRIGDIVCNKQTKFPMKVVALFEDCTVYLDFEGNEGDVFEENCKDLEFVVDVQQKSEKVKYVKCFYNEGTKRTYKTLKEVKLANVTARIYRCWLLNDEIKGMTPIGVCGEQVCTIANADKRISEAIKSGTVGVGFKDKRMC